MRLTIILSVALLLVAIVWLSWPAGEMKRSTAMGEESTADSGTLEKATFGSGCFWCTEAIFERINGVHSVVSGYSGGQVKNPTYKQVCTGLTGHAEVVQLTYDPKVVSYDELLEVFWRTHDPTTPNRQGADVGTQYRSVVFYHSDRQRELAEHYKQKLNEAKAFRAPVVTEISAFEEFYPAEDYHQEYYDRNSRQPYCSVVIRPKLDKLEKVFHDKLKPKEKSIEKIRKTKAQWRSEMTDLQYYVTREKGTERAFTGDFWNHKEEGTYRCVGCGLPLFESDSKFDSGCGWPSFDAPLHDAHIEEETDRSHGMIRTEVKCARCDAHMGHVFNDGPGPTGLRYCINSAALEFEKDDETEK